MASEETPSTLEKLLLIVFIAAILLGNICVVITYFIRAHGKHWTNVYVLAMALIDLVIGGFVLPLRYLNRWHTARSVAETWSFSAFIYTLVLMVITYLYRCKLFFCLPIIWLSFLLFYGIPGIIGAMTDPIDHPSWMFYTEMIIVYALPLLCLLVGLALLLRRFCRNSQQRSLIRHVSILAFIFLILATPWIICRIWIHRGLHITSYIILLKSVLFPILYAATNASFRVSFAIYRSQRHAFNNRVWTI